MNNNIKIAKQLVWIAKTLLAMSPHRIPKGDVIRMQGKYHNDAGNFDAIVTSEDSRKLNNEARPESEDKGIPKSDIEEIFKKTEELFRQASFLDHQVGTHNNNTQSQDDYDRNRYVTNTTINGTSYKITYVVKVPNPKSKQTNTSIKLHYMYIDKQ